MRFLLLSLLLPVAAYGQGTTRLWRNTAIQPELQAEVSINAQSLAYLAVGGLRYTDPNSLVPDRLLELDTRYLAAGYEQELRPGRWSWGATARVAGSAYTGTVVQPGLLLRHRSPLGPLTFGQRLGAEYAFGDTRLNPAYSLLGPYFAASPLLVRLRFDLYPTKGLALGQGASLTPRLSFEPALFLRLQRAATDPDKRTIDYTGLRFDLTAAFPQARLDVAPWFALQTQYVSSLVQYDSQGNPTSNGKLNVRLPTAGLEVRYHLLPGKEEQLRLPTQH